MKRLSVITRYLDFISFLLRDAVWRNKRQTFLVVLTSVIGVGSQVMVFGLALLYAKRFATGDMLTLSGTAIDPRESVILLAAGSAVVTVLLLLSAFSLYYSRRGILQMARTYEEYCTKRVFGLLGGRGDPFSTIEGNVNGESYLMRLVASDTRLAGRVLRVLLSLIVPSITLLVSVSVLFYLESVLTFVVGSLGIVLLFYQYRVSRRAAQHSMRFENLGPSANAEYRALIQHHKHQAHSLVDKELAERLFAGGSVRKRLDAYEGRLLAVENSRLVSGLFTAVVLGLILLFMGGGIIRAGAGWERLLVYVVALRFAMVNLQNVFSAITSINRFYPQVRRYLAFVNSFSEEDKEQRLPRDVYTLEVEGKEEYSILQGSMPRYEARQGTRLALVTPLDLNRYTIAGLCESLLGAEEPTAYSVVHASRYAAVDHSCPTVSLRKALGLSPDSSWEDLREWFPGDERFAQARAQLPKALDSLISPRLWKDVAPELKFVLSLISARVNGCAWIFMEAEGLHRLGPDAARFYLALFYDALSLVVYGSDYERVGSFDEHAVVVADEEGLLGLGSKEWWRRVRETVSEAMSTRAGVRGKRVAGGGDVDEFNE